MLQEKDSRIQRFLVSLIGVIPRSCFSFLRHHLLIKTVGGVMADSVRLTLGGVANPDSSIHCKVSRSCSCTPESVPLYRFVYRFAGIWSANKVVLPSNHHF